MSHSVFPMTVALVLAALPALAQDVNVEVANNSALTLLELHASPVAAPDWGRDLLGSVFVAPGERGSVVVADGAANCQYDFQFMMEDGSVAELRADICVAPVVTLP